MSRCFLFPFRDLRRLHHGLATAGLSLFGSPLLAAEDTGQTTWLTWRNGDEINAKAITVACEPFAEPLVIERKQIEKIVHINSRYLRYSGPDHLSDWTSQGRDRKTSEWFTDLKGAFATHPWPGEIFREIEFPKAVEIRFSAEVSNRSSNLELRICDPSGKEIASFDEVIVERTKKEGLTRGLQGNDSLSGDGFSLGGTTKVMGSEAGQSLVGWLPPGASEPVTFAEKIEATVIRGPHPTAEPKMAFDIGQARVFLSNREVLSGSLISITKDTVHFKSQVTGQIAIPASKVEAVDIGSVRRVLEGFGDSEWEEIEDYEDEVTVTKDKVRLKGGSFGNPSLVVGDRIRFTAKWLNSNGVITLRFFSNGPDTSSPSTDIIIAAQGSRLFVGRLKEPGALSFSGNQIPITDSEATLEISADPEKIEVFVNDKSTLNLAVDPEQVSGNGIYFEMGGGWQGWNENENEIEITNFRVTRSPGSIPLCIIDIEAKKMALTIPRSLRDPLPTHVLVAPNGDLLRGNLEAATSNSIRFTSKEKTFEFPYSRISAIVWLQEPVEIKIPESAVSDDKPAVPPGGKEFLVTHQFTLMDGSRLHLSGKWIENDRFVGESSVLGRCEFSIENVHEMRRGPLRPIEKIAGAETNSLSGWKVVLTAGPVISGTEDAPESPLVRKPGPPAPPPTRGDAR